MKIEDIFEDNPLYYYIKSLVFGKGIAGYDSLGNALYNSIIQTGDSFEVLEIFQERFNNNQIVIRYKYQDYINDNEMQDTIKGLGMNPDAFWLLIVFCLDYACDKCNGFYFKRYKGSNVKEITNAINAYTDEKNKSSLTQKMTLTLKTKGRSVTITDEKAILAISACLEENMDNISEFIKKSRPKSEFESCEESDSVLIWYFAKLLLYFFELHPEFTRRAIKGSGRTFNKRILISNLIYHTRLSRNDKFLNDDETLKGFLKQYKNKEIEAYGNIYL